jgi:hypothetical protein
VGTPGTAEFGQGSPTIIQKGGYAMKVKKVEVVKPTSSWGG